MIKTLPIDKNTFSSLIKENCLYIDKTEHIYNLFKSTKRYYFLSRPRRFGKSLLISTLKEFFSGNKDLFKGLYLEKSDWKWEQFPIIHLDFGSIAHRTTHELRESLSLHLDRIGKSYQIDLSSIKSSTDKFFTLVTTLSEKNKVVILIDEYDKPILDHVTNTHEAKAQQEELKYFYDCLKGLDEHLRAIFITGVSKFSKTSIFSGLNNLNEISLDPIAATITGYTENELRSNFTDYLELLREQENVPAETLMQQIKIWYNGYQFSSEPVKVYNPFSIMYLLEKKVFANYWFESGTPSFLINLLKQKSIEFKNFEQIAFSSSTLGTFDIETLPLITLLYQAGYLTIKSSIKLNQSYFLTYPNREVKESFLSLELGTSTYLSSATATSAINSIELALDRKDLTTFFNTIRMLFANIPYELHLKNEAYYHSLFQLIGTLLGFKMQSEVLTSVGRIDMTLETNNYIFVIEFKFNKTATEAMQQINEQRYYEKYLVKSKEIILVGASFNYTEEKREIDWISYPYQ